MPDGTGTQLLQQAAVNPCLFAGQPGRRDKRSAKVVYQAQALRRAFGRRAAYTFMVAKRLPNELVLRVLSLPDQQLRR